MKDMKISTRLMLGFALMCALMLALGAVALWEGGKLESGFGVVVEQDMPRLEMIKRHRRAALRDRD